MTPSIYACMQLKEVWNMPHQTHDVERGGIGRESVEYNREVVHVMNECPPAVSMSVSSSRLVDANAALPSTHLQSIIGGKVTALSLH